MKNPFEYPAPPNWPADTLIAVVVEQQQEIVRKADAKKCREILAWPYTGITIRKATERRLGKLERAAR